MKFTIDAEVLADGIAAAISSLPARPTTPILGGVLVEARIGAVSLSSFNWDQCTTRTVNADVDDTDTAVVSGRLLATVGSILPKMGHATITATESEMEIRAGRATFRLPLMHAADYPALLALKDDQLIGTVDCESLTNAVRAVGSFAATDEALASQGLTALNLAAEQDHLVLRATDRYIAARRRIPWQSSHPASDYNVSAGDLVATIKALDYGSIDQRIEMLCDDSLLGLRTPQTTVVTRLLDTDFPNVQRVMTVEGHHCAATLPTGSLLAMVKRAASIADDQHTRIVVAVADDALSVTTDDDSPGGLADSTDVIQRGPDRRLTLSSRLVHRALAAIDDEAVTVAFQETGYLVHLYPGVIGGDLRPPDTDTVAMVMGIRGKR